MKDKKELEMKSKPINILVNLGENMKAISQTNDTRINHKLKTINIDRMKEKEEEAKMIKERGRKENEERRRREEKISDSHMKEIKVNNVRSMIRKKIVKIMKDKVKNFTINVNKFIIDRTMIASNEMVNEFKSKTNAQAIAENILKDVTLVASGGAEIDIRQDTSAQLEMAAIVNIFSDDERKDGLLAKVIESLKSSLKNDPKFMNKIVQAGKIEEMAK